MEITSFNHLGGDMGTQLDKDLSFRKSSLAVVFVILVVLVDHHRRRCSNLLRNSSVNFTFGICAFR